MSASSWLRLLQSHQQTYGLRRRLLFQASRSSPNQIYRRKHCYSKKPGRRKAQLFHFPSNSIPELANTAETYAANLNKDQIITAVNNILPRVQVCIESNRRAFEYKLKLFKKKCNRYFCIADIFPSNDQH